MGQAVLTPLLLFKMFVIIEYLTDCKVCAIICFLWIENIVQCTERVYEWLENGNLFQNGLINVIHDEERNC